MNSTRKIVPDLLDRRNDRMFIINQYNFGDDPRFIITIDTTKGTGSSFTLPTRNGYTYNCTVDWGDGSTSEITAYNDADITHTYASGGVYQIKISGTFQAWYFNNGGDKLKLTKIDNWGKVGFMTFERSFYGCTNLISIPSENINDTGVTSLAYMFYNCSGLTTIYASTFAKLVNVLSGLGIFRGCSGITSIPKDIFRYNIEITTLQEVFMSCTGITGTLPTDLFRYNINVTIFAYSLYECRNITLSENLFYYNNKVTNYVYCFYLSRNISLPSVLFNLANLSIVTDFTRFMGVSSTGYSATGTIQDIWNYTTATSSEAFKNDTSLTNYASIPNGWKGL
jgi:hypothetical protein